MKVPGRSTTSSLFLPPGQRIKAFSGEFADACRRLRDFPDIITLKAFGRSGGPDVFHIRAYEQGALVNHVLPETQSSITQPTMIWNPGKFPPPVIKVLIPKSNQSDPMTAPKMLSRRNRSCLLSK